MAAGKLGDEKKKGDDPSMASVKSFTGQDAYRALGLCRKKVKGDGSCMYYAVLATVFRCDHAHTRNERTPSARDRGLDAMLRAVTVAWLHANHEVQNFTDEETTSIDSHLTMPNYPLITTKDFGTFGTNINVLALAAFFETPIIVWDRTTLLITNTLVQVYDVNHDDDGEVVVAECYWSYEYVLTKADERTLMHIEFDGVNHYAALVGTQAVPLLDHVSLKLDNATPIEACTSAAKKRGANAANVLPTGWVELTDKYRDVDDAHSDITVAETIFDDVITQLNDAIVNGFNAVMYLFEPPLTNRQCVRKVMYIRYSGAIDETSCQDTDTTSTLFVFNDPKKKQKILPPVDNFSCCGLYRLSGDDSIDCCSCSRYFHASCIAPTGMTKKQRSHWDATVAPTWVCEACDDSAVAK